MFEIDGDFDLDEDFLQEVFQSECGPTVGKETEGVKRTLSTEVPSASPKKHKRCNREQDANHNEPWLSNINNKTEKYEESSDVGGTEAEGRDRIAVRLMHTPLRSRPTIHESPFSKNFCRGNPHDIFESSPLDVECKKQHYAACKVTPRPEATPQRRGYLSNNSSFRMVRQRKFPGPAGLLPDRDCSLNASPCTSADTSLEICHSEGPVCSQLSSSVFEGALWLQMLKDFDLSEGNTPLSQFTVAWVKRRAAARQLLDQRVPFLAAVLHDMDCSSPDPCVVLRDRTGEIHGTLHHEVWEEYGGQLSPGSVLVLRQVGVLSIGLSARRHYLNVTSNNIIVIYSSASSDDTAVRTTTVHGVTQTDLLKSFTDWQTRSSVPDAAASTSSSVSSMFSTVGSALQKNANRGNFSPLSSHPSARQLVHSVAVMPRTSGNFVLNQAGASVQTVRNKINSSVSSAVCRKDVTRSSSNCGAAKPQDVLNTKVVASETFNFQPQPTPRFSPNCSTSFRMNTPSFKGGFTPKVSRFDSPTPVTPQCRTLFPSSNDHLHAAGSSVDTSKPEDESSVLDLLTGIDTSTLFDDF